MTRPLANGDPIRVASVGDRIGAGPWARWVASAIVPDEGSAVAERGRGLARDAAVWGVTVTEGRIAARVTGSTGTDYEVSLDAAPIAAEKWVAAVRESRERTGFEDGIEGTGQSIHLAHYMGAELDEPLVPPTRRVRTACSCPHRERSPVCKHIAALAFVVADAIDADPSMLLLWRGCEPVEPPASRSGDPWRVGRLPEPRPARALPPGAVVKRLGRSGIRVGGRDLAEALEPAYRAFAASASRPSRPDGGIIETWSSDSAS